MQRELLVRNPFAELKGTVGSNRERDYFVDRATAVKVLDACPDAEWQLLFALSRFAGLRCPSEHLALRWGDVNWEAGRITVPSPKTAHHGDAKASRVIPLWPELRQYLLAVWNEATSAEGFDPKTNRLSEQPVITRYRDANANLRTQFERIIKRAGLKAWPKLFQNLRASRATELASEFPAARRSRVAGPLNARRKQALLASDGRRLRQGRGGSRRSGAKCGAVRRTLRVAVSRTTIRPRKEKPRICWGLRFRAQPRKTGAWAAQDSNL